MEPRHIASSTFTPLVGFLIGLFAVRLAGPLALYLMTLWVAWHGFEWLGQPDFAHLLHQAFGWEIGPSKLWRLIAALALIAAGLVMVVRGHAAQARQQPSDGFATEGIYRWLRHPQYAGCIALMLGVFAMWPEPVNAVLFIVFGGLYIVLAVVEDRALARAHGPLWLQYAQRTPAFLPGPRW